MAFIIRNFVVALNPSSLLPTPNKSLHSRFYFKISLKWRNFFLRHCHCLRFGPHVLLLSHSCLLYCLTSLPPSGVSFSKTHLVMLFSCLKVFMSSWVLQNYICSLLSAPCISRIICYHCYHSHMFQ